MKSKFIKQTRKIKNYKERIIPKINLNNLPPNTKKFIEASTQEIFYFTWDRLIYKEDNFGNLKRVEDFNTLFPSDINLVGNQEGRHTKNSLSAKLNTPVSFGHERSVSKPDKLNTAESLWNLNSNNVHAPFGMSSPSLNDRVIRTDEYGMNPEMQSQMKFQVGATPAKTIFKRTFGANF